MNKEKEWFIEAPWGRICVVAWGDCFNPPVLMMHGSKDTAATFRPLVAMLPAKFYYIAIELPGNGKSDWYPPGMMMTMYDFVYNVVLVVRHFRWEQFIFMGHSMGTLIGKLYNLSYPGVISKVIELDPVTSYAVVEPQKFGAWYHHIFTKYYEEYEKFNSPKGNAPKYTIQEALQSLTSHRDLTEETALATIERMTEPAGDGLIRFTTDNRYKKIASVPFSSKTIKNIFIQITTPTLVIAFEDSIKNGSYGLTNFTIDETAHPSRNCRVRIVPGHHDIHFTNPERLSTYVSQFLLYGLDGVSKAKL